MLNTLKRLYFRKKTVENRAKNVTHRKKRTGRKYSSIFMGYCFSQARKLYSFLLLYYIPFSVSCFFYSFFFTTSDYGFAAEDPNQGDDW